MKKISKIIFSLLLSVCMLTNNFVYAEDTTYTNGEETQETAQEETTVTEVGTPSVSEPGEVTDTEEMGTAPEIKEEGEMGEGTEEEVSQVSPAPSPNADRVVIPFEDGQALEENVEDMESGGEEGLEERLEEETPEKDMSIIYNYDFGSLDFSSKRLIIQTFLPELLDGETPVISQYENAYLIQYETEEEAKYDYIRYKGTEGILTIEPDVVSFELDEGENGDVQETIMTEGENPFDSLKEELETPTANTSKIKVAVIDSGVAENAANEYVDFTNSSTVYDENGHGTRIAEIIKDYSYGNAYIISVKAFDRFGHSSSSIMYSAITYAIEQNVDVINISASANDSEDAELLKQVLLIATQRGITVVGSAGNRNIDASGRIPVNVGEVIGVTSLNDDKTIKGGYGAYVDLGVIVGSTSEATAIVSGSLIAKKVNLKSKKEIYKLESNGSYAGNVVDEESEWELDCNTIFYGDAYYWALPYGATTTANAVLFGAEYQEEKLTSKSGTANGYGLGNASCSNGGSYDGGYDDNETLDPTHGYAIYATTHRHCSCSREYGGDDGTIHWNGGTRTVRYKANIPNYNYKGYVLTQNKESTYPPGAPGARNVSSLNTGTSVTVEMGEPGEDDGGWPLYAFQNQRKGGFRVDFYYVLAGYPLTINYYEEGTTTKVYNTVVQPHPEGDNYSVASPNGREKGYRITRAFFKTDNVPYANKDLISGTMPAKALEYDVFYKKTNLRVTKTWNGDIEPTSVNFVILDSSGNQYKTGTLTAANNWTTVVEKVDYGKTYSIYESNLNTNNYTSTCTASHPCTISTDETSNTTDIYRAVTITNRRINEITVNKEWTEEAGDTSDRPESFKVHLIDMNTKRDVLPAATLNAGNGWSYTWKDVSIDIATINYGVWEEVPDLYDCPNFDANSAKPVTKTAGKKSFATVLLTNEYTPVFPKHKNVFNTDNVNIDNEIVRNGDTLKYVITFTNPTGMEKKFDIEDVIPENSEFISAENGGTLSGNKVSWKNIAVPGRGTGSVTFYVMAIGDRSHYVTIENTAQVWMIKKDGRRVITDKPDPETGIKSPDTETRHNYVPPTSAGPEGTIKSVTDVFNVDIDTEYVEKDDNLYYHILVNNGAPLNKTFTVTDKIPENTEFVSVGEYGTFANNTVTFVKEIPAKTRQEFTFVVKATKDNSDIINIANVAVDHVNWDTNTVTNKTAKIVINKSISNYYENFGKPSFTYEIKGSDGQVAYRMIELDNAVNGTAEFTVPRYTEDNVTFTVDEIRNGRYDFQSLGTDTPNTTTLQNSLANIKFTEGNRLSVLNYQNIINEWDKNSHADSVTNKVRK